MTQQKTPTEKVGLILRGSDGSLDGEHYTWYCQGTGDEVWYIKTNRNGAFVDENTVYNDVFKRLVKRALGNGGDLTVGREEWPSRYQNEYPGVTA